MKLGRLEVTASRWPWQGYGWFPHKNGKGPKAPLNRSGARFGAGWAWSLGVQIGVSGRTVIVDLLFGSIRIYLAPKVAAK